MVKRRDLNAPLGQRMADIVRQIQEENRQKTTGAHGIKDLGENGDVVWDVVGEDGETKTRSVKRFSVELDDTTERAKELADRLEAAEGTIEAEQARLDQTREDLDGMDTRVGEASDAAAAADAKAAEAQEAADAAKADAQAARDIADDAQGRVDARLDAGDSILVNGGFEHGDTGWRNPGASHNGRSRIIESPDSHSGTHVLEMTPGGGYVYPESVDYPIAAGQTIYARGWMKVVEMAEGSRLGLLFRAVDKDGGFLQTNYFGGTRGWVYPDEVEVGEWVKLEGDATMPEGTVAFRAAFHAVGPSDIVIHADDLQVVDVTEARAAQAAADSAAGDAAEALAEARYAPRIANRPPTAEDGASKPDGAGWLEYDPDGQTLIQFWRWDGSAWQRMDMDPVIIPVIQIGTGTVGDLTGDRITVTGEFVARVAEILQLSVENLVVTGDAVVNELVAQAIAAATAEFQEAYIQNLRTNGAVIDEAVIGDLAANIITSGLFRTAEEGQRLEIDSNGLVMFGVDPDGAEFEMVRLGPSGENLLTIGETTVTPTSVQSGAGAFDSLSVGGEDLQTILDGLPKGVVAWGYLDQNSDYSTNTANDGDRRAELQTNVEPDRTYRLSVSSHFLDTTASSARIVEKVKSSFDYTPIYSSTTSGVTVRNYNRHYLQGNSIYTVPGSEHVFTTEGQTQASRPFWAMLFVKPESSNWPVRLVGRADYPMVMMLEDLGPAQASILKRWNDTDGGGSQDPEPVKQRYVKTYNPTGYRCYNYNGNSAGTPDVVQGLYAGGGSNLRRRGGWTFPTMTGDLSGATIEKIEAYFFCDHTYYSGGATVNPAVWGGTMVDGLSAFTTRYDWKRGTGKWITLPSSYYSGFKSGQYAGVGVIPTSSSAQQYARFPPDGAKIRITYVK